MPEDSQQHINDRICSSIQARLKALIKKPLIEKKLRLMIKTKLPQMVNAQIRTKLLGKI